ncbi:hypothetical protein [Deinococcus sp. 6GRE01]|uniref:hypothetical protein n=1 Tax=Deinococcus sp. 6GRE01 TaxID=2745873 RepID=UPI001E358101|nr:hypothetical protein [Deinococcus sp. 6GRE01]MCD0155816.1 hypothetical protein [Deinococcus sp. 6GRE01]
MSEQFLEALALVETVFGSQVNPVREQRDNRYWTPEEEKLLSLITSEGMREAVLRRSQHAIKSRVNLLFKSGRPSSELSEEQEVLCFQWSHIRALTTPMHWQWGQPVPEGVWSPGEGIHLIVVGDGDLTDAAHKRVVAGAAQVDLIAVASRRPGVEVAVINGTRAWNEQVRKGVRTLLKTPRLPNALLQEPEDVRAPVVVAVGPRGIEPRFVDLLPAGVGVIAVIPQSKQLNDILESWKEKRTVTVFQIPHLNATGAAAPLSWVDVRHLPDAGRVTAVKPETALRFAYGYARRYQRLPTSATPEVDALLDGRTTTPGKSIVDLLVKHFQKLLIPYTSEPRGRLILDVREWDDERAAQPPKMHPLNARAGL